MLKIGQTPNLDHCCALVRILACWHPASPCYHLPVHLQKAEVQGGKRFFLKMRERTCPTSDFSCSSARSKTGGVVTPEPNECPMHCPHGKCWSWTCEFQLPHGLQQKHWPVQSVQIIELDVGCPMYLNDKKCNSKYLWILSWITWDWRWLKAFEGNDSSQDCSHLRYSGDVQLCVALAAPMRRPRLGLLSLQGELSLIETTNQPTDYPCHALAYAFHIRATVQQVWNTSTRQHLSESASGPAGGDSF